jgi:hypothetical protein
MVEESDLHIFPLDFVTTVVTVELPNCYENIPQILCNENANASLKRNLRSDNLQPGVTIGHRTVFTNFIRQISCLQFANHLPCQKKLRSVCKPEVQYWLYKEVPLGPTFIHSTPHSSVSWISSPRCSLTLLSVCFHHFFFSRGPIGVKVLVQ